LTQEENEANWQRKVGIPFAFLVSAMQQLSMWGLAMSEATISCVFFSLGVLPTAVANESHGMIVALMLIATVLPAYIMCA
jgi:hypothetical protein